MADDKDEGNGPATSRVKDSRQHRLKSALRENLKRRKVQARERAASSGPSQVDDGSLDEGTAEKT